MLPQPTLITPIPELTVSVAQAAFPKGNTFMLMRDALGTIFTDRDFAELFPDRGQPGLSPWRLALVTIMQFVAGRSDRQAAEAVRSRIDWKYALSLELTVLCTGVHSPSTFTRRPSSLCAADSLTL